MLGSLEAKCNSVCNGTMSWPRELVAEARALTFDLQRHMQTSQQSWLFGKCQPPGGWGHSVGGDAAFDGTGSVAGGILVRNKNWCCRKL